MKIVSPLTLKAIHWKFLDDLATTHAHNHMRPQSHEVKTSEPP